MNEFGEGGGNWRIIGIIKLLKIFNNGEKDKGSKAGARAHIHPPVPTPWSVRLKHVC